MRAAPLAARARRGETGGVNLDDFLSNPLVELLAVVGAVALVLRLAKALLHLGVVAAELTAVSGLAEVSARSGDLTSMAERQAAERALRRSRQRARALVLVWLLLLVVPPMADVAPLVYAPAALLWLLPAAPVRLPRPPAGPA